MTTNIHFKTNPKKAVESALWLIERAGGEMNLYNLLKSIFCAECNHINEYGVPIYGDSYVAMRHGTVASCLYDIIKGDMLEIAYLEEEPLNYNKKTYIVTGNRLPYLDELSQSNIESLEYGFKEYGNLSFTEVREKNHKNDAWEIIWNNSPNSPIPIEMLIDDKEIISELSQYSKHMVI